MKTQHKNQPWLIGLSLITMLVTCSGCAANGALALGAGEGTPLTASGTIRATEIRVASEQGGRIEEIAVEAGDQVQKGAVIVTTDETPWLIQLYPAEAAVATAQADLDKLLAGTRPEEIAAARAALALAEAQRDGAQSAWKNAQAEVSNPQELNAQIIEAKTQAALAAQGVEMAESELQIAEFTYDRKDLPEKQFDEWELRASQEALAAAEADQKAAQAALDHLVGIRNRPLGYIAQANASKGQYEVAEEAVAVAQAKLADLLDGATDEEIAVAEAAVRKAEAEASVIRVQLEKCTISSPIDGIVLEQALQEGEIAPPSATIMTLADLSEVNLEVYVPENRVGQVTLGATVQVSVDSFPGQTFEGQVTRIGDEPEFTPRNVATAEERLNTFYVVEIRLPNPEGLLKPGMPADAVF